MSVKISPRNKYTALISPQRDQNTPIYNWHSFKHSYSKELVEGLISEFGLRKGSWILDPYCGGGTTLLASKQAKINSQGVDILPFSVFLSNVKIRHYNEFSLLKELEELRNKPKQLSVNKGLPDDISLLEKAFPPLIKKELLIIKEHIDRIKKTYNRDFFNLAFLSILESVSNTTKGGGFLRIVDRNFSPRLVHPLFLNKCASMIGDVINNNNVFKQNSITASAKLGDARKLPLKREFSAIITSPPYPNRHDYTRIYSLEMVFDFVANNDELKQIRYDTLRSHVEARKKYNSENYEVPTKLIKLIAQITKNGTNNPQITDMLEGYFEDMFLSLQQMKKRLVKKGKIALVVSNVRFSGVSIPVDQLLSEIGAQAGLTPKTIWVARKRGNSAQQMKKYQRRPSRESIIVWKKN